MSVDNVNDRRLLQIKEMGLTPFSPGNGRYAVDMRNGSGDYGWLYKIALTKKPEKCRILDYEEIQLIINDIEQGKYATPT